MTINILLEQRQKSMEAEAVTSENRRIDNVLTAVSTMRFGWLIKPQIL